MPLSCTVDLVLASYFAFAVAQPSVVHSPARKFRTMALLQLPSAGAIFAPVKYTRKTAHSRCLKVFAHLPESSTRPEKTSAGHAALLTAASFAVQACSSSPASAAELAGSVNSAVPFALAGGGAIAALAAALSLSDPEKRYRCRHLHIYRQTTRQRICWHSD